MYKKLFFAFIQNDSQRIYQSNKLINFTGHTLLVYIGQKIRINLFFLPLFSNIFKNINKDLKKNYANICNSRLYKYFP